jgi:CRP/FNR family transcriptional regulator
MLEPRTRLLHIRGMRASTPQGQPPDGPLTPAEVLNQFDFFRALPASEQARGLAEARLVSLPNRAWFYHQGQRLDQFGLVGGGSIRVFRVGESGREITLYHVRAKETCLVNMLSVLLDRETCASAQAEGTVIAVLVPGDVVRAWVRSSDTFRSFAFDAVGQRLIDVMTLVEEVAFRRMDQRLAEYLRLRVANDGIVMATHEDIASELGTAREVVSRLLASFAHQGAIVLSRGRIQILQLERLAGSPPEVLVTKSQTPGPDRC